MTRINRRIALPLLTAALTLALGGCIEDETIVIPFEQTETQRFFQRYVAMGNSLTAGFMSGGINDSTQRLAYPVLLADMAEAGFSVPSLVAPGCPPPLVGAVDTDEAGNVVVETDRVGGGTSSTCALRATPIPEVVQNVAVPGAKMADALDIDRPGNSSNTLTTLINGGASQVDAMRRARPTFVSSWLGNNDALGAALRGDTTLLTPVDTFEFYQDRVASGIAGSGTLGAALIGVIDIMLAPALQPGLYYWVADSLGLAPKPADASCGPTDETGAPNPMSMNVVSRLAWTDAAVEVVSCDPAAPYVLTIPEQLAIEEAITAYNNILQLEATSRGWVYVNATGILEGALGSSGARHNRLRRCEFLSNTQTPDAMVATFIAQCPHTSAPNYFGSFVTYDGIHISAEGHEILAEEIAADLNSAYDLEL